MAVNKYLQNQSTNKMHVQSQETRPLITYHLETSLKINNISYHVENGLVVKTLDS